MGATRNLRFEYSLQNETVSRFTSTITVRGVYMWLTLMLAVITCVGVLYVPGYILARSLSIVRFSSLAIAPLLSIFLFTILGIVLEKLGITCPASILLATSIVLCLVALVVSKILVRTTGITTPQVLVPIKNIKAAWKTAALYIAFSFIIVFIVFLLAIDGPNSFARNDDTTVHLSVVRGFLETGTYSTLNISSYLDQGIDGGFYPAAWHIITAIVASFFGNDVALAANAVFVVFAVFVFPLGVCLLLMKLFREDKRIVLAGSLFVLAFCGFPWGFVVWGQLFSNMVSFMLIPLALVALIEATEAEKLCDRIKLAVIVCAGLIAIAVSQPNGAFTFGIWAVLYSLNRTFFLPHSNKATLSLKRFAVATALLLSACAIWAILYFSPFMQVVVQTTWEAVTSPIKAVGFGLLFMFGPREGIQPFLTLVVIAGIIYTCKNRRYLWLSIAYVFALLVFIIDYSTDGILKQVLSGFWYTDYYRTGAMTSLFAIPLAAIGFVQLTNFLKKWCSKVFGLNPQNPKGKYLPIGALLILFAVCQFFPGHVKLTEKVDIYAGLPKIHKEVSARYSWDSIYTDEEHAFVKKVLEVIPEGALVINVPNDGSCWSYGIDGINTYFRRSSSNGRDGAAASEALRTKLCDISSSEEVRKLVEELDARYVLMLDESTGDDRTTTGLRYKAENWHGIESINEETPGFTLVLSEGDMRLYEIDNLI